MRTLIRGLRARLDPKTIARETVGLLVYAVIVASFASNIRAYFDVEWLVAVMAGFAILCGVVLPLLDVAAGPADEDLTAGCTGCGGPAIRWFWADRPEWPTCEACGQPGTTGAAPLVDYGRDVVVSFEQTQEDAVEALTRHQAAGLLAEPVGTPGTPDAAQLAALNEVLNVLGPPPGWHPGGVQRQVPMSNPPKPNPSRRAGAGPGDGGQHDQ